MKILIRWFNLKWHKGNKYLKPYASKLLVVVMSEHNVTVNVK